MADEVPTNDAPPFVTADTMLPGGAERAAKLNTDQLHPHSGLSVTPGLVRIPNSTAPMYGDGSEESHVMGPQQMPCDPIAAGLDLKANPMTRNENRVVTQTGELAAGPRPSTYKEKAGDPIKQSTDADHKNVPMPSDADAAKGLGPNSVEGGEPVADKT